MAALLRCRGAAVFEENLFSSRYRHVDELARMGEDIRVSGRTAVVLGVERLHGAAVRCTDLRGGAALCAAALAAEGETSISDITHIDRGYQSIEDDLAALGADKDTAVYVGDSEVDVATARNAGLDMIGVAWGFRGRAALEAAGAPLVADTPEQLLDMLQ